MISGWTMLAVVGWTLAAGGWASYFYQKKAMSDVLEAVNAAYRPNTVYRSAAPRPPQAQAARQKTNKELN